MYIMVVLMDTALVTRSYLETLSSSELFALADEYGIDIPDNLNRRFIIGELLEAAEDMADSEKDTIQIAESMPETIELPDHYNETMICAIMRNPVWCYVYWEISEAERSEIKHHPAFESVVLRVSFLETAASDRPTESFDISVSLSDREQYVLLPSSESFCRIDLCAEFRNAKPRLLAKSAVIRIPQGCPEISTVTMQKEISPIMQLSGLDDLLKTHYQNHRHSFS